MANEKRLIPFGEKISLYDLPFGTMFAFGDDCIAVKSEYTVGNGLIEAFILGSGEQFWGGAKTAKEQNELMVQPLDIVDVEAVPVVHGRWEDCSDKYEKGMNLRCLVCGGRADSFVGGTEDWYCLWKPNFCPRCGAKMDGDGNG